MPSNFDDIFIGRENRESNYRTWSERAVVVGFNAEEETYDIVITTEKTLGNNVRTLNRVIRKIKAVIDPQTRTFLPGESIIVGYVDDRREHPIIVGLGDSSDHTCIKVTLGVTSTTPTIEGPTAPSLVDPVFNIFFLPLQMSCIDPNQGGSQTGTTCTVDCSATLPEIRFQAQFGTPSYTWEISTPPAGCTYGGVGGPGLGEPTIDGVNNSRLVITAPVTGTNPVGVAFKILWHTDFDCLPAGTSTILEWDIGCDGLEESPGCFSVGNPSLCYPLDVNAPVHCNYFICSTGPFPQTACPNNNTCTGGRCPFIQSLGEDFVTANAPKDNVVDSRTESMLAAGCCPCNLAFNSLIVTVTDAAGISVSKAVA